MRYHEILGELAGIKQHTSQDLNFWNVADYLYQKFGFRYLDSGELGHVFLDPTDNKRVIKIYADRAYDVFIDFCKRNSGNPFLPRFKGNPVLLKTGNFGRHNQAVAKMIRMERLTPIPYLKYDKINTMIKRAKTYLKHKPAAPEDLKTWEQNRNMIAKYSENNKQLFEILCKLIGTARKNKLHFDIHEGNMMMRGSQIVIIDPFSPE